MIIFTAAYRIWKNGVKQSVPAPWDPDTPDVPVWYDHIASLGPRLAAAGYTHVLLPPSCKTQSGNLPTGDGYGKFDDYDIGSKNQCGSVSTRFGTRDQWLRCIAVLRANGLKVIGEAVTHQYDGGQKDGVYVYADATGHTPYLAGTTETNPDGSAWTRWAIDPTKGNKTTGGRFPKFQPCFWNANAGETIPPFVPVDPVWNTEGNFPFGNGVSVVNSEPPDYMASGEIDSSDWLVRTCGFDGMRVDDVKGMYSPFIRRFITSKSMANLWTFSELFDNADACANWLWSSWSSINGCTSVLDFDTHFHLQDVLDKGFPMTHLNGAGYTARDPYHSVTFVDSPDTDSAYAQQIVNSKLLAYAFICACEGVPSVFYRDWAKDTGCYGLGHYIDNLVWINRMLAGGPTVTRYVDENSIVLNRLGWGSQPGVLVALNKDTWNSKTLTVQTGFWGGTHLHDFSGHIGDVWCDSAGRVTFTVPPDAFGQGQSFVCLSWAGMQGVNVPVVTRSTRQTFFGADDLDIPAAAPNTTTPTGRIWCEENTQISVTYSAPGTPGLVFSVTGPDGSPLSLVLSPGLFQTAKRGWHQVSVQNLNATDAVPYEAQVEYTAPQALIPGGDF